MPRRPTRSRSNAPTRKELDRRLDDLTEEDYEDLEPLYLCEALSYETEVVNDDVLRIVETGELRRRGENNLGEVLNTE